MKQKTYIKIRQALILIILLMIIGILGFFGYIAYESSQHGTTESGVHYQLIGCKKYSKGWDCWDEWHK